MGVSGFCCRLLLAFFAALVALNVCLTFPALEAQYIRFVDTQVAPLPPLRNLLYVLGTFHIAFDWGVVFVAPLWNPRLVSATNGHQAPGIMLVPNLIKFDPTSYMLLRVSHESIKKIHYSKDTKRPAELFVTCNTTKTPLGYFGEGVLPVLLQMGPADPRRLAHRDLLVATLPALSEHPSSETEFKPLSGLTVEDVIADVKFHLAFPFPTLVTDKIQNLFAYQFFRHLFAIELSGTDIDALKEWTTVNAPILLGFGSESGAKRSSELSNHFVQLVLRSELGRQLAHEAERRGMNGEQRVRKTLFELVFAGFGGNAPGGALACLRLLKEIQKNPSERIPLFKRDPKAFVLEAMRQRGGGGAGMNPIIVPETVTHTLPTGFKVTEKAGDYLGTVTIHGNHDPEVFGGPEKSNDYAQAFLPGRENADRLLNFVAEVRDIRKCPNMTGCDEAPRFCLGTFLMLRLNEQIATWYVEGLERSLKKTGKDEM
eukprot:TRINITY_DN52465_c0_g2_i1.p1 TRINITY_DN52465_c0_g2~~TRINITY_DN52465_c0_g2_i1.p1  ORF type:complete len:485 (+),score=98.46 TRINITY_DN52465_c0_g2_i1:59-1513(+)